MHDNDGNLVFSQKKDKDDNLIYESIMIVPNEGCTELDATISLPSSTKVIQLVEDDNVKALDRENEEDENELCYRYSVKINSPIYIKPVLDENGVNNGGWVQVTATQNLLSTSCMVFVDIPVKSMEMVFDAAEQYETTVDENEDVVYNIYPNSVIHLTNNILPTKSMQMPKTSRSISTFDLNKTVVYEISNEEIASVDSNGNVTVNKGKEGQSFSVTSYIISRYNDLDKVPTLQEFIDNPDPSQSATPEELYRRALNAMAVRSNTVYFYINNYDIEGLEVQKVAEPDFNVFDSGSIKFINTKDIGKVENANYAVNVVVNGEVDDSTINEIISQIEIKAFYQGEEVENVTIDDNTIVINRNNSGVYHKLVDASDYITIENIGGVWKYVVKQALVDTDFYLLFYYRTEESVIWDYEIFTITDTKVSNISLSKNTEYITYEEDATYINYKNKYSLKDVATIYPNNSTYKSIVYFVEADDIVRIDDQTKITNNGKIYYAVAALDDDGEKDNFTLEPLGKVGATNAYAVVLKTIPVVENGEIIGYEYLTLDDYIQFDRISDPIVVDVARDIEFNDIAVTDESENVKDGSIVYDNPENPRAVSAQVYAGGKLCLQFAYNGEADYLNGSRFRISLILGGDADIATVGDRLNDAENSVYNFTIYAGDKVGTAQFQAIFIGADGEKAYYTVDIEVLSTALVGTELFSSYIETEDTEFDENKTYYVLNEHSEYIKFEGTEFEDSVTYYEKHTESTISISFDDNNGEISYAWNDYEITVEFDSPKTDITTFELIAYTLPEDFNEDYLQYYSGKSYTEIISEIDDENINSIQKLVAWLGEHGSTNDVITIDNMREDHEPEGDAYIVYGENNIAAYSFVKLGKVLMFASSIGAEIYSNPILIEITIPEITIKYGLNGQGVNAKEVVSYGDMTSIDGKLTPAKSINLYLADDEVITFWVTEDEKEYDVSDLISFKFEKPEEDNDFVSKQSGAIIDGFNLKLCDINKTYVEKILAFSNFGYIADFYTYTLQPNYKLTQNNSNKSYYTPSCIDLFGGTNSDLPDIYITDRNYQIGVASEQNRLYLPINYIDVENLSTKFPEDFLEDFYYADDENSDPYYHIYCIIAFGSANIDSLGSAEYWVDNNIITLSFTEQAKTISINLSIPIRPQIDIEPGVSKNFTESAYLALNIQEDKQYNLSSDLTFTDRTGEDNYQARIENIDFAVTSNTDENLLFYKNGDDRLLVSYAPLEDDLGYISQEEYDVLEDKTGYNYYFVITEDNVPGAKEYYEKNINGDFDKVTTPDFDDLKPYYEKVYSNKTYFANVEAYFEEISAAEVSKEYIKQYYVLNSNNNYEAATSYKSGTTYFHKHNFAKIDAGGDISGDIFYEYTITLTKNSNDEIILNVNKEISTIENSVEVLFDLEVKVSNNTDESYSYYYGYYYKITFQGYDD